MSKKTISMIALTVLICAVMLCGCGEKKELALKFAQNQTGTYKASHEAYKEYKFDQPSINQSKHEKAGSEMEIIFTQNVKSVKDDGSAIIDVTIKQLKLQSQNPKAENFIFDSENPADKTKKLSNLIDKSYEIKMMPDGRVEVYDAAKIRNILQTGSEAQIASNILSDDAIKARHSVLALPESAKKKIAIGQKWSIVRKGPKGMLKPKAYEKFYTLNEIVPQDGQEIAVVTMSAAATDKPVEGQDEDEAQAGLMEKMFDTSDVYTGKLVLNLTTGTVEKYEEQLEDVWVASEEEAKQKSDKGPDTITMSFTYKFALEKIN